MPYLFPSLGTRPFPSPSRGSAHHMRAGHLQGRNRTRARAHSAVPGPPAGPPPLRAVISLLEVGWDWNPSAQAEAIISPAEEEERPLQQSGPGSRCTSRQWKGRSCHGHVLTEPRCCLWPEQRGTTKTIAIFSKPQWKGGSQNDASNLSFYFSSIN